MNPTTPRILIVDDSATFRLWLLMLLEGPYEMHVAEDGQEGVECALRVQPHLILLDVEMPRKDGLAACRELRAHPATCHTPIILVTSRREEWDLEAGYISGCTDYIKKPVDQAELLAKIESWLQASPALADA